MVVVGRSETIWKRRRRKRMMMKMDDVDDHDKGNE